MAALKIIFAFSRDCVCLIDPLKDEGEYSEEESDPDSFKIFVSLHKLLLQLHDLGHGFILHVLQFLCHLKGPQRRAKVSTGDVKSLLTTTSI